MEPVMQDRVVMSRALAGIVILVFGGVVGCALLLEKNGNNAIFGTGTSITTAVLVGIALMAPGAALVLGSLPFVTRQSVLHKPSPRLANVGIWLLFALSITAVLYLVQLCFGMTPRLPVPKSTISWPINYAMTDFFHEGEIIGGIGFFLPGTAQDIPMLVHGPGRNLLPAWIVSHFGGADTKVAEMRFITSAGNFLGMFLAAAGALAATLVIALRQTPVALPRGRALCYGAAGMVFAVMLAATIGRITNREAVLFAVILISVLLIWSAASERRRLASGLAVLLGVITTLSPLHTYLGGIQSVMVASTAAVIALTVAPGQRLALFIRGLLGAVVTFATVSLLGGYGLFSDTVSAILYWSENAEAIWGRFAPRIVLVGSLGLMVAGTALAGFCLAGKAVGMGDKAARGVLLLLVAIIVISTFSYANLSDMNHFGYGLYVSTAALAGLVSVLLLTVDRVYPPAALALTALLVVPSSARLLTMDGSGIVQSVSLLDTPDAEILPTRLYDFAARYSEELADQDCLLIMSNDGALAYLPRAPLCGPFFNPIHLNAEGDAYLANWLESNPQRLVVDGVGDYGSVGGPPMRDRFPLTYEVIDRLYPKVERLEEWEIRLP